MSKRRGGEQREGERLKKRGRLKEKRRKIERRAVGVSDKDKVREK